jgi:FkbM family methyltransferase
MATGPPPAVPAYTPHPSCQIPDLGRILAERFNLKRDGTFVEVGAFDGETCSNTSFLADLGWRGLYIEPVPPYAEACRVRHRRNANVWVIECAIGAVEQPVTLTIGHVLTTADAQMAEAYGEIAWARGLQTEHRLTVPQRRLETVLKEARIARGLDLLVIDVEGGEESVFDSFELAYWRPGMMIVELEDDHPSFQDFPAIVERSRRLRARILAQGYVALFQDHINTIFWDATVSR